MDREASASFVKTAEAGLASVRGSLLLLAQDVASVDITAVMQQLAGLKELAAASGRFSLAERSTACAAAVSAAAVTPAQAYNALDIVAAMEAELFRAPLAENGFPTDVSEFVEESFGELVYTNAPPADTVTTFQIDAETLEIFRSEAEELLASISLGIDVLAASPSDQNALWDIRRCAHTFKGAAGIVGLVEAASVAHRMEDLLDRAVEINGTIAPAVVDFMRGCVRSLESVVDGAPANAVGLELAFEGALRTLASPPKQVEPAAALVSSSTVPRQGLKPIVRVSLERLNEIVRLADELMVNRSVLLRHLSDAKTLSTGAEIERLVDDGGRLSADIHDRLVRIRMVRFGTLATRLARAVNVTAAEEHKKVRFEIETPEVEIDTLVIDALVEPLLHLLKNAVVHGIESSEVRRMIGKHECGLISISVVADHEAVLVCIADDGGGIATAKLKERAIQRNILSVKDAGSMSDHQTYDLLFDKGLSTVDHVNLNAGRGVGLSIVKEAVESRGGSVHVESMPQIGSRFTLILPAYQDAVEPVESNNGRPEAAVPLVLIVDDSASIRRHTQRFVEEAGFRVITAADGADALELLLNGSVEPDLVLSDVEMPHIDGWGLLEYLKTDEHLGHVPVVMVTSLDDEKYREKAFDLGAADYLVKPFGEKDIERVLALLNVPA
jgi:chemotaxis protein histidine kinase CheA